MFQYTTHISQLVDSDWEESVFSWPRVDFDGWHNKGRQAESPLGNPSLQTQGCLRRNPICLPLLTDRQSSAHIFSINVYSYPVQDGIIRINIRNTNRICTNFHFYI